MSALIASVHEEDGRLVLASSQDVEPVLDGCHARRVCGLTGSGEMRHAASIPQVLVEAYCNDRGISFREFLANPAHARTMLNDPALAAFRVWEGRV